MYSTSEFRNGLKILFNDAACIIVEFQHVKPGKGGAFVRTRMKNLKTGLILEHTFRSGEKVGKPDLQERNMQFLYASDDEFNFMDMDNYEQVQIGGEMLGDKVGYLGENQEVVMLFHGDYKDGGYPTAMRLFGEGTLQRLTFVWLMLTIQAGVFMVYTFNVYSNITIALSIALGVWAFLTSIKLLKKEFHLTDARGIFWKINAAFLGIIVLLSIDEYVKHHL